MSDLKELCEILEETMPENYESLNTWKVLNKLFFQQKIIKDFDDLWFSLIVSLTSQSISQTDYKTVIGAIMYFDNDLGIKVLKILNNDQTLYRYEVIILSKRKDFVNMRPIISYSKEENSRIMKSLQKY